MKQLGQPASLETEAPQMNLAESFRFIEITHATLQSRRLSFTDLAYAMHVRLDTLHNQFAKVGYRVNVKRGPLPIMSLNETRQRIQKLHEVEDIRCGYKRTAEFIADETQPPPYNQVTPLCSPIVPCMRQNKNHTRVALRPNSWIIFGTRICTS
jgi:hypothetical protein